eukprot:PITA_35248
MDVKTTFLHGDLEEEIYMKQPEGFAVKGKKERTGMQVKEVSVWVKTVTKDVVVYVKTREGALDSSEAGFQVFACTSDYGLCYQGRPGLDRVLDIRGFVDADWAGDLDQRRSTSGYVFNLFGGVVSWMSKKQSIVALSTTEVEYMATTHASKEVVSL